MPQESVWSMLLDSISFFCISFHLAVMKALAGVSLGIDKTHVMSLHHCVWHLLALLAVV